MSYLCMTFVMYRNCKKLVVHILQWELWFIKKGYVFKITLAIYLLNPPLVNNKYLK